jgi:hypothetical protein
VLQFDVEITSPGFLGVITVFGSDEYDQYIFREFNDSFAILIKNECTEYENIAVLNDGGMLKPFSLQAIQECGSPHFLENQVAPQPFALPSSLHAIDKNSDGVGDAADGVPHYDHEFGGFTAPRTWETKCPLAPGTYTVKFVVHDIADARVDAALFIQADTLYLFDFLPADFDLDGDVDSQDYLIWNSNLGLTGTAKFTDGDANGDCSVTTADLAFWVANFGAMGGHRNLNFDFDRDSSINGQDLLIWQRNLGMMNCASRRHGDSNGDGAVDQSDNPWGGGGSTIADPCGSAAPAAMAAGGVTADEGATGETSDFDAVDMDEDGDFDSDDAEAWLETQEQLE